MAPFLKAPCLLPAPEFKQKEECTIRGRNLIQISIQEDPWNLPNSIKTLVDNIQRYVEGQSGREGCYVEGLWPPVLNVEHGRVSSGSTSVPPSLQALGEDRKRQCCFLRTAHTWSGNCSSGVPGASLQNQEAEEAKLVPSQLPQLWI